MLIRTVPAWLSPYLCPASVMNGRIMTARDPSLLLFSPWLPFREFFFFGRCKPLCTLAFRTLLTEFLSLPRRPGATCRHGF